MSKVSTQPSIQSLIEEAEGKLQEFRDLMLHRPENPRLIEESCISITQWTLRTLDSGLQEQVSGRMNRTIRIMRDDRQRYDNALVALRAGRRLVSECVVNRKAQMTLRNVVAREHRKAVPPYQRSGTRTDHSERYDYYGRQFDKPLKLWEPKMLFEEVPLDVQEPDDGASCPRLEEVSEEPVDFVCPDHLRDCEFRLFDPEVRVYLKRLPSNEDPFANRILNLLGSAVTSLEHVLLACDALLVPDRRNKHFWRQMDELHMSDLLTELREHLLQGRDAEVAAAWAWLGLNVAAYSASPPKVFEVAKEQQDELRAYLRDGPQGGLWLTFASTVGGALGMVVADLRLIRKAVGQEPIKAESGSSGAGEQGTEDPKPPIIPPFPTRLFPKLGTWSAIERAILKCLYEKARTCEALAYPTGYSSEAVRDALLKGRVLRVSGIVANRRGLGFYRTDAPPQDILSHKPPESPHTKPNQAVSKP